MNDNSKCSGQQEIPQDIAIAVEALDELRNSHGRQHEGRAGEEGQDTLLDKVRSNSIINNAVNLYEQSKHQYPSFRKGAEMMERKALIPMVRKLEKTSNKWKRRGKRAHEDGINSDEEEREEEVETEYEDSNALESDSEDHGPRISKRQKISEAIAKGKGNLKGYKLNMSIESKKRLVTCLHLLKLANNQLSNKVSFLQELVQQEQRTRKSRRSKAIKSGTSEEHSDNEQFFDASDNLDEQSTVIKMEVVGTVKKVYSIVSKFTGSSLPEPARSQVRETLLKLPTNWSTSMNSTNMSKYTSSKKISTNGKVLILARESLDMVGNVMNVVDNTLGKAEEWVKHKKELKEMLKEQFVQTQMREKVKQQIVKERGETM